MLDSTRRAGLGAHGEGQGRFRVVPRWPAGQACGSAGGKQPPLWAGGRADVRLEERDPQPVSSWMLPPSPPWAGREVPGHLWNARLGRGRPSPRRASGQWPREPHSRTGRSQLGCQPGGAPGAWETGGGRLCAPHHTHQPGRTRRLSGLGQHGLEEGWEGPEEGG